MIKSIKEKPYFSFLDSVNIALKKQMSACELHKGLYYSLLE